MTTQQNLQSEDDLFFPRGLDLPGPDSQGAASISGGTALSRGRAVWVADWLAKKCFAGIRNTLIGSAIGVIATWLFFPVAFALLVNLLAFAGDDWGVMNWGEQLLENLRNR